MTNAPVETSVPAETTPVAPAAVAAGDETTGPRQFPAVDNDTIRRAFEAGHYPYARPMGTRLYEAEKASCRPSF